jgi:anti-anti-sigma factor
MRNHQTSRFRACPLRIQDLVSGGSHRLMLSGELDAAGADELGAVIFRLFDGHLKMLTLDCTKLTFLDASGLRVVRLARDLCHEQGWDFGIVPGPARVRHALEFSGLGPHPPSRADAEDRFSSAGEPCDFDRQMVSGDHR